MGESSINTAYPIPSETIALELDTIGIVETILNQISGRVYDPSVNGYREIGKRMVNEKGEKEIATVLASYVSRDKILSILSEDDVKMITWEAGEALADLFTLKFKEFEIDKADLSIVLAIIEHSIYVNLKRAQDGRTLDHIGNVVRINEKAKERSGWGGMPAIFGKPKPQPIPTLPEGYQE